MKWDNIQELPCSIARALSIVGDRWTMLILRDCFLGTKRFDKFQKHIGLSRHRLTDRLNKLVEHEVLKKVAYQNKPPRYEYKLTKKGVSLYPVLMTLAKWGDDWMSGGLGAPVEYKHANCNHKIQMNLCCSECGEIINPKEVIPQIGPGLIAYSKSTKAKGDL
ncbi:MAG: winged helix-turn-helix transcriptional regulator [Oleiphilus sp.]